MDHWYKTSLAEFFSDIYVLSKQTCVFPLYEEKRIV